MKRFFSNRIAIAIFVLPTLVIFTVYVVYPIIPLFITSLQENDGINVYRFLGLENYKAIFSDSLLWRANLNTLIVTAIGALLFNSISLAMAFLLYTPDKHSKFRSFCKKAYFLPVVVSVPIICQTWLAIYQPQWGLLNGFLHAIGLDSLRFEWLTNQFTVLPAIVLVLFWQNMGFTVMIFTAGLYNIPMQYYEAALIDGANRVQISLKVLVPMLREIIRFLFFTAVIGCMSLFSHVMIMTKGGPADRSYTLIYMMYQFAFARSKFGVGSAIAVFYIVERLVFTIFIYRSASRESQLEY
jgi:ABC-type sugar transport system permease subunit